MKQAWWVAFVVAMAGLGAVACNGGGGQTGTPEATLGVSTVVPGTPFPVPTITGNRLEYPGKGYSVQFPDGWTVDSNVVAFGSLTADAFFAPEEVAGVQPSIAVNREEVGEASSLETYLDGKVKTAEGLGAQNLDVKTGSTVAGREASILNYGLVRDSVQLEKREVVFVDNGVGWVIALTVPPGQGATYYPLFDQFLASFRLFAPAQPTPSVQ